MNDQLEFDGERFTPESVREIWYEHMHRYAFAMKLVDGLNVLDAACGEGYGSAILAGCAGSVIGVDVSAKAIEHAHRRYTQGNLTFKQADCSALPFDDDQFDCIVSFETIEHLDAQAEMLAEFRRVLKPKGFLLISSPDKAIYSDAQGFDNPHHVRELYRDEFQALLDVQFPVTRMFGQKLLFHSAIWPLVEQAEPKAMAVHLQNHRENSVNSVNSPVQPAMYLLAICAADECAMPPLNDSMWLFDDNQESVYQHYQHEIRKNMQTGGILADRDRELQQLRDELQKVRVQPAHQPSWLERLGLARRR